MLFHYSDDDYIDEDEKRIENSGSNKRVKVGRGQVNLIPGGLKTPDEADAAKKTYTIKRQKFREERCCERLRAAKGVLFDK